MRPAYPTDLTDDQWGRVYPAVLAPAGYPESVRDVLDAVRYRNRTCVVWWLLPPTLPPAAEVQRVYEEWVASGVWPLVEAVLDPAKVAVPPRGHVAPPAPPPAPRLPLKKRVGKAVRAVPGGRFALVPPRLAVQGVQSAARQFSPHHRALRRFGDRINAADKLLGGKDKSRYPDAVAAYTDLLREQPGHGHLHLNRARAYYLLDEFEAAERDAWAVLGTGNSVAYHWGAAHLLIGWCRALLATDLDAAGRHLCEAEWNARRHEAGVVDTLGPITRLETLMKVHDDLAEHLINYHQNFDLAIAVYRHKPAARAPYLPRVHEYTPPGVLYLGEDWVRNIGHTALLDTMAKARRMGWLEANKLVLLAPPARTANLHYAKYWAGEYDVVSDTRLVDTLTPIAHGTSPRVASILRTPDGTDRYLTEALGVVQQAWEAQGREPLLKVTPADEEHGRGVLRALGVPDDGWFVCLHVRDAGYHGEKEQRHQAHRNADVFTYLPALREVVRRGGWVIRLGDNSMAPLPTTPGVIDYARSLLKSQRTDIFLVGKCRFFVGLASGLCHVPTTFGVPCVITNWVSNALPVYSKDDLFLPKLFRGPTGRLMGFPDMYGADTRRRAYAGSALDDRGIALVDNTPDEILEVVAEMLDRLEGKATYTPHDHALQGRLADTLRASGVDGFARIGRDFLRRHAGLLAPAAVPPHRAAA